MKKQVQKSRKRLSVRALRFALKARTIAFEPRNNPWVVVYPESGLIYNRIKKSGNTSIRFFLNEALGTDGSGSLHPHCPMDLPAATIRELDSFYLFTIFRNPYARCLSGFLDKMNGTRERYAKHPGFGDVSIRAFDNFVGYLESGGLYANRHWWPQVDLLFRPPRYFDHIGQLENLEEEMQYIFQNKGIPLPDSLNFNAPHPREQKKPEKVTQASRKMQQYYTDDLYRRVYALYRGDFEVGGYDPL